LRDEDRELPQVWTPEDEQQEVERVDARGRFSKAATWSLVLGLLAWLLCLGPLAALPGLLLSLIGLRKTGSRRMLGRGRAWLGLLLSSLCIAAWITLFVNDEWRSQALLHCEDLREKLAAATDSGSGPAANERKARRALRRLRAAQQKHKVTHGTYARGLGSLVADDPGCAPIATSYNKRAPYNGYYFASVIKRGTGFVNHTRDFLICAFPAKPGKSGHRTLTIDSTGTVRGKDVGGKRPGDAEGVKNWPRAD
jgi:hypothetical protein